MHAREWLASRASSPRNSSTCWDSRSEPLSASAPSGSDVDDTWLALDDTAESDPILELAGISDAAADCIKGYLVEGKVPSLEAFDVVRHAARSR